MRRENRAQRRSPYRQPQSRILIVCGGCRTEPRYFEGLRQAKRNPAVVVRVVAKGCSPAQLVEHSVRLRDKAGDGFDHVWCVVDVDQFDIAAAVRIAAECGVELAVSNPCFEVWLLWHFVSCQSSMAGYDDVVRRLRKHVRDYAKADLVFRHFAGGVEDAVTRAEAVDPTAREHGLNPSSGVWKLVRVITTA